MAEKRGGSRPYRWGVAVAAVTAFLTVWTTIVRDDGAGIGWFLIIMATEVGAFAAWFRADGMARTILGVAIMQALFATAIATAPVTATLPDRGLRALGRKRRVHIALAGVGGLLPSGGETRLNLALRTRELWAKPERGRAPSEAYHDCRPARIG